MRKTVRTLLVSGAFIGLAGCTTTDAFKDQAADFLEGDAVSDAVGQAFSEATCEEPENTDVGTVFECTATGADAVEYVFTVEITGEKEFTVQNYEPAG
jgi:hypothetical protein